MALNKCLFNGNELPLQFEIQPIYGVRLAIDDTITSSVVQCLSYYKGDEKFDFTCNTCSTIIKNLFVTAFKNSDLVWFQDYDSNLMKIILIELNIREVAGLWNISGKMKRMPEYES